jgi:hypothetical protein
MIGSAIVYVGLVTALLGVLFVLKPVARLRVRTRRRGAAIAAGGLALAVVGLFLPAPESRAAAPRTRLDELAPAWQFSERHTRHVAAPPERVFEAVRAVRADEIRLFNVLTWIRRGGRPLPESILNPGARDPLLDVATRSGFVWLADDPPRELAVGAIVVRPPGEQQQQRVRATPEAFRTPLPAGYGLAVMNFHVTPDAAGGGSLLSTETRVYTNDATARRRFAAYWRLIYPGSALIRRMWLRAIARRAEGEA